MSRGTAVVSSGTGQCVCVLCWRRYTDLPQGFRFLFVVLVPLAGAAAAAAAAGAGAGVLVVVVLLLAADVRRR